MFQTSNLTESYSIPFATVRLKFSRTHWHYSDKNDPILFIPRNTEIQQQHQQKHLQRNKTKTILSLPHAFTEDTIRHKIVSSPTPTMEK